MPFDQIDYDRILRTPIPLRKRLYPLENKYFSRNPNVAGMAAEDNSVILNPDSRLSDQEKAAVVQNEKARIFMRKSGILPDFSLTDEQQNAFKNYGNSEDIRQTLVGRIISGDPSALNATQEQRDFAQIIKLYLDYIEGLQNKGK